MADDLGTWHRPHDTRAVDPRLYAGVGRPMLTREKLRYPSRAFKSRSATT